MARLPEARYTREFKIHAVSMAREEGPGIAETARRLSIASKTIANWVKQVQEGAAGFHKRVLFLEQTPRQGRRLGAHGRCCQSSPSKNAWHIWGRTAP